MMAGAILVILGLSGMGSAIRFIPRPVVVGFTNGIGVLIASTQLKDFFGLGVPMPGEFWPRMVTIARNLPASSPRAVTLGAATIALLIVWRRFVPRVPGYIVALLGGTAGVIIFGLNVETIGTRFGGIPSGWPTLPSRSFESIWCQACSSRRSPWRFSAGWSR